MGRAGLNVAAHMVAGGCHVVWIDEELDGTLNGFGVASNGGAVVVQDGAFLLEVLNAAAYVVPDVGVLGYDAQCQFLAAAADDQRRETIDGGSG